MGYAVKFTGSNMDQILEKSKSFKSHNEDWVIIPSSINISTRLSLFLNFALFINIYLSS